MAAVVTHRMSLKDILENEPEAYYEKRELLEPLKVMYRSLIETHDHYIANGRLLDVIRQVSCFGLGLVQLDVRQESSRHSDALDAITKYLGLGSYKCVPVARLHPPALPAASQEKACILALRNER